LEAFYCFFLIESNFFLTKTCLLEAFYCLFGAQKEIFFPVRFSQYFFLTALWSPTCLCGWLSYERCPHKCGI
jgi:hypothetical protein